MTSFWRTGMVVAIFAALLGAPSAVLGAPPNELLGASVSDTSGTTSTVFVFRVRYVSTAGNGAGNVTVAVALRTVAMSRVSGTATDGAYQVSSKLPVGTWTPTFHAYPAKGPAPSLAGPPIRVTGAVAPAPTMAVSQPALEPTAAPAASADIAGESAPTPAPESKPQPAAVAPSPSADTARAKPETARAPASDGALATPATERASGPSRSPEAAPVDASATPAAEAPGTVASPSVSRGSPAPGNLGPTITNDSELPVPLVTVAAVVTAILGGVWWLFLVRKRREDGEDRLVAAGNRRRGSGAVPITQVLAERAARRSRLDASDDPIVAAMGLPPRKGSTPRFHAGQVNDGPGERPITKPRRRRGS